MYLPIWKPVWNTRDSIPAPHFLHFISLWLTFVYQGLIPPAYTPLSILAETIIGPDAPNKEHRVYSLWATTDFYNEYHRLRSDVSWGRHHSSTPPRSENEPSTKREALTWQTFLTLFNASSITNPTILLVDRQLFKLFWKLIYHYTSPNCVLCAAQAHDYWLFCIRWPVLYCINKDFFVDLKAVKGGELLLGYWNPRYFAIQGWHYWMSHGHPVTSCRIIFVWELNTRF